MLLVWCWNWSLHRFSPTCESLGNGGYQCTACQPGYTGQYCERYVKFHKCHDETFTRNSSSINDYYWVYFVKSCFFVFRQLCSRIRWQPTGEREVSSIRWWGCVWLQKRDQTLFMFMIEKYFLKKVKVVLLLRGNKVLPKMKETTPVCTSCSLYSWGSPPVKLKRFIFTLCFFLFLKTSFQPASCLHALSAKTLRCWNGINLRWKYIKKPQGTTWWCPSRFVLWDKMSG